MTAQPETAAEQPLLQLRDVSLCYRLAKQNVPSLKDYAIHFLKGALTYEELWALRDITAEIGAGETVGIVGRNGAGKSTLLKVISGVLKATRGEVLRRGRVAPILELGTGFDGELTGRENIYLNALLLGRRRDEIDEQVDAIIEFSGLSEFIQVPVRNYSSGMLARLGFAIATAWRPELLILDEVLAVGDARFLARCKQRIDDFHRAGSTILLVSHDLEAVRATCRRALWLERGELRGDGPTDGILARYQEFSDSAA